MKKIVSIFSMFFLLFSMFLIVPKNAYACSCAPPPSVADELKQSDVVVSGVILDVKEKRSLEGFLYKSVFVKVKDSFKGTKDTQIKIVTGQGGGDCGIDFIPGVEYLIYARYGDFYGEKGLETVMCDRTAKLTQASGDLSYLGKGEKPTNTVDTLNQDKNNFFFYGFSLTLLILTVLFIHIRYKNK